VRKSTLVRVGGVAAILAGLLRAYAAVAPGTGSDVQRQFLYFVVDLLLLLGSIAAYAEHHERLGRSGAGAFLITVTGLLLVRSSRAVPGLDLYPAGAASVAVGWIVLAFMWVEAVTWLAVRAAPLAAVPGAGRGQPVRRRCRDAFGRVGVALRRCNGRSRPAAGFWPATAADVNDECGRFRRFTGTRARPPASRAPRRRPGRRRTVGRARFAATSPASLAGNRTLS